MRQSRRAETCRSRPSERDSFRECGASFREHALCGVWVLQVQGAEGHCNLVGPDPGDDVAADGGAELPQGDIVVLHGLFGEAARRQALPVDRDEGVEGAKAGRDTTEGGRDEA